MVAAKLNLLTPKPNAVWYGGQIRAIQWQFRGTADAVVSIFIEDVKNGYVGRPYPYVIVSKLPATPSITGTSGYRWQVPFSFRTSPGYQIRIVAEWPQDPTKGPMTTVQNGTFTIVQIGDATQTTPTPGPSLPTPTV
jgi:hypothetical protein